MIPQNQGRRSNIQRSYVTANPTETANSTNFDSSIPNSSNQRKRERIFIEDKDDRYNRKRRTVEKVYIKPPQTPANNSSNSRPKERVYIESTNESIDEKTEKTNVTPFQQQVNTTKSRPKERQYVGSSYEDQFVDKKAEKSNVPPFQQQNNNTSNSRPTERVYVTAITNNDEPEKSEKTNHQQQPPQKDSDCIIF